MKLLWIEDFGGGLTGSKIVIEMFSSLIPKEIFDAEYDEDHDIIIELPPLFEKYTLHQIYVCRSYLEWKEVYAQQRGDFDIALIDINLENYKTPQEKIPEGLDAANFDKKAGFHIYYQLIKAGFPDKNIAFFTGEVNSLNDFSEHCSKMLIDKPQHTFEKKPADYGKLRMWLKDQEKAPYLTLRRGILEGCRLVREELGNIHDGDLEERLLFYKTTRVKIETNPRFYRTDFDEYLTNLERFFPLRQPPDKELAYFLFVKELVSCWDMSGGYFQGGRQNFPKFHSRLEGHFHKTIQFLMKVVRNWTVHDLLVRELSEKEVAYLFMLAIRARIYFDVTTIFNYEKVLSKLFPPLSQENKNSPIHDQMEGLLKHSHNNLKSYYDTVIQFLEEKPSFIPKDNFFLSMGKTCGELPDRLPRYLLETNKQRLQKVIAQFSGSSRQLVKDMVGDLHKFSNRHNSEMLSIFSALLKRLFREEISLRLLYQFYWHGLFSWSKKQSIDSSKPEFTISSLPESSFLHFLGCLIITESFQNIGE